MHTNEERVFSGPTTATTPPPTHGLHNKYIYTPVYLHIRDYTDCKIKYLKMCQETTHHFLVGVSKCIYLTAVCARYYLLL